MLWTVCEGFSSSALGNPNALYKSEGSLLSWLGRRAAPLSPAQPGTARGQASAPAESRVIRHVRVLTDAEVESPHRESAAL